MPHEGGQGTKVSHNMRCRQKGEALGPPQTKKVLRLGGVKLLYLSSMDVMTYQTFPWLTILLQIVTVAVSDRFVSYTY